MKTQQQTVFVPKTKWLFALFVFLCLESYAQAPGWLWAGSAGGTGGDDGRAITVDGAGNVFVAGDFWSSAIVFDTTTLSTNGAEDIFVTKYDYVGNLAWAVSAGGTGSDHAFAIAADDSGNVFVAGRFGSPTIAFGSTTLTLTGSLYDIFLAKYDPSGNALWAVRAGGSDWEDCFGVKTDAFGNVYITGYFKSGSIAFGSTTLTNSGLEDFYLAKYDANGNAIWAKQVGGTGDDNGNALDVDYYGNVYVTGYFKSTSVSFDTITLYSSPLAGTENFFIAKYDSNGNALWAKNASGSSRGQAIAVHGGFGNALYVTGFFNSTAVFGSDTLNSAGLSDIFVACYNSSGNLLWTHSFGGTGDDYPSGIIFNYYGSAVVTGYFMSPTLSFGSTTLTNTGSGFNDMFVAAYLWSIPAWATNTSGIGSEMSAGIVEANPGFWLTGSYLFGSVSFGAYTLTNAGNSDIFIAELDEPTGFDVLSTQKPISIYPNPSTGAFNVQSTGFVPEEIAVYNVLGEKVYSQFARSNSESIRSKLNPGIYLVSVASGAKLFTSKLIIE